MLLKEKVQPPRQLRKKCLTISFEDVMLIPVYEAGGKNSAMCPVIQIQSRSIFLLYVRNNTGQFLVSLTCCCFHCGQCLRKLAPKDPHLPNSLSRECCCWPALTIFLCSSSVFVCLYVCVLFSEPHPIYKSSSCLTPSNGFFLF